MKGKNSKQKGNCGLSAAITYFTINNKVVSIPLNDSQDYDFVADVDGSLRKIQVKTTTQRSRKTGHYIVDLRSTGGTKGTTYKKVKESDCEYLFAVSEDYKMWLVPVDEIAQDSCVTLNESYQKYYIGTLSINDMVS